MSSVRLTSFFVLRLYTKISDWLAVFPTNAIASPFGDQSTENIPASPNDSCSWSPLATSIRKIASWFPALLEIAIRLPSGDQLIPGVRRCSSSKLFVVCPFTSFWMMLPSVAFMMKTSKYSFRFEMNATLSP